MRISVGNLLTIRGHGFSSKAKRNTVIFRAGNGRTAFAKPSRASSTKLVVRVPAAVARLLTVKNSKQRPTRLKLRVLAGKFSAYTNRRLSPVVTGAGDGDGGGNAAKVCKDDSDHDNDLLPNDLELQIGTDPCLEDTDDDHMSDGWEYYSAKDLNVKAVPYPGKRPYPNPLDPSDGGAGQASPYDFDGDGLTTREEYRAWVITGSSFIASKIGGTDLESPLGYSDGTKFSRRQRDAGRAELAQLQVRPVEPGAAVPGDLRPQGRRGLARSGARRRRRRPQQPHGVRQGPEHQRLVEQLLGERQALLARRSSPGARSSTAERRAPATSTERPFAELDLADSDVDGDGLLDGEDDQDNDDVNNITEVYEEEKDLDGNGALRAHRTRRGAATGSAWFRRSTSAAWIRRSTRSTPARRIRTPAPARTTLPF